MDLPAAIIYINKEINNTTISNLTTQLHLTEVISAEEFNLRITAVPSYPEVIHFQNLRVLVIQDSIRDLYNRELADIVLFFHQGLVDVEKSNYGEPQLSLTVSQLDIYSLLRFNKSTEVTVLPVTYSPPSCSVGGIFAINSKDRSGVHSPNTDNLAHNTDFINRK